MAKRGLSQKDYGELIQTAQDIVRYERGEKVVGFKKVIRRVLVSAADVKAARKTSQGLKS